MTGFGCVFFKISTSFSLLFKMNRLHEVAVLPEIPATERSKLKYNMVMCFPCPSVTVRRV